MVSSRSKLLVWSDPGGHDFEEESQLSAIGAGVADGLGARLAIRDDSPFDEPPLDKPPVVEFEDEDNADTHDGRIVSRFQRLRDLQIAVKFCQTQKKESSPGERIDEDDGAATEEECTTSDAAGVPMSIPRTPTKEKHKKTSSHSVFSLRSSDEGDDDDSKAFGSKFPRENRFDAACNMNSSSSSSNNPGAASLQDSIDQASTFDTVSTACSEDSEDYNSPNKDFFTDDDDEQMVQTPTRVAVASGSFGVAVTPEKQQADDAMDDDDDDDDDDDIADDDDDEEWRSFAGCTNFFTTIGIERDGLAASWKDSAAKIGRQNSSERLNYDTYSMKRTEPSGTKPGDAAARMAQFASHASIWCKDDAFNTPGFTTLSARQAGCCQCHDANVSFMQVTPKDDEKITIPIKTTPEVCDPSVPAVTPSSMAAVRKEEGKEDDDEFGRSEDFQNLFNLRDLQSRLNSVMDKFACDGSDIDMASITDAMTTNCDGNCKRSD
jgi:hypothetical protein